MEAKKSQVSLKIKFKSETLEAFIERYAVDVSQGGIFIRTKEPQAVGTSMKFEFQLRDQTPLIAGEGTVVWTRENDPTRPNAAPGMGVRFDKLADGSQEVLEKILAEKAKQGPSRQSGGDTKPPAFNEVPTRIAPSPLVDQLSSETKVADARARLAGVGAAAAVADAAASSFGGGGGAFDDAAFSEATKIRTLDELVAQTGPSGGDFANAKGGVNDFGAEATRVQTLDELVAEAEAKGGKTGEAAAALGEVTAKATSEPAKVEVAAEPAKAPAKAETSKSEPAKAETTKAEPTKAEPAEAARAKSDSRAPARATAAPEPKTVAPPVAPTKSPVGGILFVLFLFGLAGAAYWFFAIRGKKPGNPPAVPAAGSAGSATAAPTPTPLAGSAARGSAMAGSAAPGSAAAGSGSAAPTPAVERVPTTITSTTVGATIAIAGGPSGASPLTAPLPRGIPHKATISAPGHVAQTIDVIGGTAPAAVALAAKPRLVRVESTPPGGQILIDRRNTGKVTPADIELTAAQAAKASLRIGVRLAGYAGFETVVDGKAFVEGDTASTATLTPTLKKAAAAPKPPPTGDSTAPPAGGEPPAPPPADPAPASP